MKKQEKLVFLRNFNEKQLVANVIRPLLETMGFKNITLTHGTGEKGIDLVFYKENEFGKREYTGVQVKAVKIHGRAGQKGNATEILTQAQMAFTHEFPDISDNRPKNIDRFMVMTSGEITGAAKKSICEQLKSLGYYKAIQFIDGDKLVNLVDEKMPAFFWEEYNYFNRYFKAMKKDFETIKDISAIGQKEAVSLEDIYVSLKLSEEFREREISPEMREKIFDEKWIEKEKKPERAIKKTRLIDPDAAVKQFHRVVILGVPGAGKTTLLKHLALKFCKENIEKQERMIVPIPITLREFSESEKGVREYIDAVFEKYRFPEAKKLVEKDLKAGKCILLLDGFDELAARENQERVAKEIHAFIEQYHGSKVLVTSRVAGYHDELPGFTRVEVMEFDKDQIKRFIYNWFGVSHKKKAESMLKAVMENENIEAMAKNPLMISIIAIIYEEDQELPQRRADLYKRAIDVLLSKWDIRKKLKNRFKADKKEYILRKLAFRSHCRNRRTMSEKEILDEIKKYSSKIGLKKEETNPFLEEIWQRSYILRQISMDTYDFLHLSFQEYFTALELKEQEDGIGTIIDHISEPWWEEPILLYAGISKDAGPLIQRIQKEVPEDIFFSNLMLFGKCIADAEFTDAALKEEITKKIWSIYDSGEYKLLKQRAMEVLRRMKPSHIIGSLINQLNDKEPGVRGFAANALGAIGSAEAIAPLLKVFKTDKYYDIRGSAANALGAIGSAEAIAPLLKALTTDKESSVRERAVDALGAIGGAEAYTSLLKALATDKDRFVRGNAAFALYAIGSAEAITPLLRALTTDKDSYVRWGAAYTLGSIGSTEAIAPLLKALFTDKDSSVRERAAFALGGIGSTEAIAPLLKALFTDKDSSVRVNAAYALGSIGSAEAIAPLQKVLKTDKHSSVRVSVAYALGSIGSAEAISFLLKALTTDKNSYARGRAAYALGDIGSAEAIAPLLQALTTAKEIDVRLGAAYALGAVGNEDAVQLLKQALKDEGKYHQRKVKDAAFEALEKISKREKIRILKAQGAGDRE